MSDDPRLAAYDPTAFDRPSVAVDVVLLTVEEERLKTLLVRRSEWPFDGHYALPGGFVRTDEELDAAARRVLATKAGLTDVFTEQLYTFGAVDRDPRMRIISVAYYALVPPERLAGQALGVLHVPWEGETGGPVEVALNGADIPLAFDHAAILGTAVQRLRGKLRYTPIGFQLLPDEFPLRRLQEVHETILGHPLNKDSFRRSMLATGYLAATGRKEQNVPYRPAELYRFTRRSAT